MQIIPGCFYTLDLLDRLRADQNIKKGRILRLIRAEQLAIIPFNIVPSDRIAHVPRYQHRKTVICQSIYFKANRKLRASPGLPLIQQKGYFFSASNPLVTANALFHRTQQVRLFIGHGQLFAPFCSSAFKDFPSIPVFHSFSESVHSFPSDF